MLKIDAIMKGRKFTEKLFGLKKKNINRALEAARDNFEEQKENAIIEYENLLVKLAEDKVDYKYTINRMIAQQQIISDAENSMEFIDKVKKDLYTDVDDSEIDDNDE